MTGSGFQVLNAIQMTDSLSALRLRNQSIDAIEGSNFFDIAYQKDVRTRQRCDRLGGRIDQLTIKIIQPSVNFQNAGPTVAGRRLDRISADAFVKSGGHFVDDAQPSLLILTNNDLARLGPRRIAAFSDQHPSTFIAVHDYDCHHWHELSTQAAIIADFYFPAHPVDHALSGRLNPFVFRGIPCGTIQWQRDFLDQHTSQMLTIERSDAPLGKHFYYPRFNYRNQVIATLSSHSPDTSIRTSEFHELSAESRWLEWVSHKVHWIVPVQDDLPIRFFDALITGGIPLIPSTLLDCVKSLGFAEHCDVYTPIDILTPDRLVSRVLNRFEREGPTGILRRYIAALESAHLESILGRIVHRVEEAITRIHTDR
jgi:hypothetical protein